MAPTACAAASEEPIPLVKLDSVVADIVPDIISFAIFTVTVPDDGKFVADAMTKLDDVVVKALVATVVAISGCTAHGGGLDNRTKGAILGGVAGGFVGNQFGRGSGNAAATALGAVMGVLFGQSLSEDNSKK